MIGVLLLRLEEIRGEIHSALATLGQAVEGLTAKVAALHSEIDGLRTDIAALKAKPEPSGCLRDILAVLRTAGRRLTTNRILEELEKAGYEWSESTVRHTLATAVASELLTNDQQSDPRGYGLS